MSGATYGAETVSTGREKGSTRWGVGADLPAPRSSIANNNKNFITDERIAA
jgi:hypothetical protein